MLITRTSVFGVTRSKELNVTPEQIARWEQGELAQNVFTQLNADDREFIISGNTTEDWERLFADNADTDV
jgi:hypothetical protein